MVVLVLNESRPQFLEMLSPAIVKDSNLQIMQEDAGDFITRSHLDAYITTAYEANEVFSVNEFF